MRTLLRKATVLGTGLGMLLATAPAKAHHAFAAEFDAKRPVDLKGTITEIEWINPHAWMHLDVKQPDGSIKKWGIELGSPNALYRRGWDKNSVPMGTQVRVTGYASKDGDTKANGRSADLPDGRKMFVGSSGTGAPDLDPKEPPDPKKPKGR